MSADAARLSAAHEQAAAARRIGFPRIVLAYDGSISSRQGLTWIPHLIAHVPGARAVVMHVHDPNAKAKSALAKQMGVEDLEEPVRTLAGVGVDARPLLVAGDPAREIPRAVTQLHADLLVSGSRGRGPFGRKVMGSNADALVRQTDANLLVARTGALPSHVVLATDGSPESVHACRFGAHLAQRWTVPATLLHVVAKEAEFPAQLATDILPRDREGFELETRVGEAADCIIDAATDTKAGLIIMGRRGQGRRPDAHAGSAAARVARASQASVLLLRRPPQA